MAATSDLRPLMSNPDNVRNVCLVGHTGHGKTVLCDAVLASLGMVSADKVGDVKLMDTRLDEKERGMSMKTSAVCLPYTISNEKNVPAEVLRGGKEFLINLIDSPGHVDFSAEVSAALRVSDGAICIVDAVDTVCVQTETVLRQAVNEGIKTIVFINKLDRMFIEMQSQPEEIYDTCSRIVESVNQVIALAKGQVSETPNAEINPEAGNVIFGSSLSMWGFSLSKFADLYAKKFGVGKDKLIHHLWGDNYFDPETKHWKRSAFTASGKELPRAFNQFVLQPIQQLLLAAQSENFEKLDKMCKSLGIELTQSDKNKGGKALMKIALQRFLPISECIFETAIVHLPSPKEAQKTRIAFLYEGSQDETVAKAMRECDASGPLMMSVTKMMAEKGAGRFFAFGRILSGTLKTGAKVAILNDKHNPEEMKGTLSKHSVQRVTLPMGKTMESIDDVPAGSICAIGGIDQFMGKGGTITSLDHCHAIRPLSFPISPVVRVSVEPTSSSDLPKLVEGLKRLSKSDTLCQTYLEETGEHIVACSGEVHLEMCLRDLREEYAGVEVRLSEPIVGFRETVFAESDRVCLSKSPNKHNRLWVKACPLANGLAADIEAGKIKPQDDPKDMAKYLHDTYEWDKDEARKVWGFGPDGQGPNLVVDITKGVQYLHEVKDSIMSGLQLATKEGVLCDEPMRGVRFNMLDVTLHADVVHRGGGQVIPTARRVFYAAQYTAQPRVLEPVLQLEITCPQQVVTSLYSLLSQRRGQIVSEEPRVGSPLYSVKAYLPVLESFGFAGALRAATGGQAFLQLAFDHWQLIGADPFDKKTKAWTIVESVRKRKGLAPDIPPLDRFMDKM